jgi:hypothetical protein
MSSATCPSCGERKGRRACPALGRSICTVCCGTKRLVEIRCPSDCTYLTSARQHPPAVVQRRRERQGRFLAAIVEGLTQGQYQLFLLFQIAIAGHAARTVSSLLDRDIADAAGALAATFETASKGIIYEHQATALPAQRLVADLRAAVEALGREGRVPRDSDLATVLRRTERAARDAEREFGGGGAYRELLADLFSGAGDQPMPGSAGEPPGSPRVIIP